MAFGTHQEMNRVLSEILPDDSLIADIGSYDGYMSQRMVDAGHRVVCVDLDLNALETGKLRNQSNLPDISDRTSFVCGNVLSLMFRENCFDAVTSTAMMQVIHPDDIPDAFREIQRVTKPGGLNGLRVYAGTPEVVNSKPEYKIFEYGELKNIYEEIGWDVIFYKDQTYPNSVKPKNPGTICTYSAVVARKPNPEQKKNESEERYLEWLKRANPEAYDYIASFRS